MAFRLPDLQSRLAIVDAMGRPLSTFLRYFNVEFKGAIERQEAAQNETIVEIQALLEQIQAASTTAQQAQQAANEAQETADEASGGGNVSGSASDPAITVGSAWEPGPIVNLIGVPSGTLKITGSGPQQDFDVSLTGGKGTGSFEFRVVEIILGVEETVFTGNFSAFNSGVGTSCAITNQSAQAVQDFSSARASTGDVSYRIDARSLSSRSLVSLLLYIFVRREA